MATTVLRSSDEIQAAHDALIQILTGQVDSPFEANPEISARLPIVVDVLCWVLRHDHNPAFGEVLRNMAEFFMRQGYDLERIE